MHPSSPQAPEGSSPSILFYRPVFALLPPDSYCNLFAFWAGAKTKSPMLKKRMNQRGPSILVFFFYTFYCFAFPNAGSCPRRLILLFWAATVVNVCSVPMFAVSSLLRTEKSNFFRENVRPSRGYSIFNTVSL
eukprot:Hpha_TRINITY_DN14173_c0_g1::TRINITY_DN14173_c0_g1_i1::g.10564::m.10564